MTAQNGEYLAESRGVPATSLADPTCDNSRRNHRRCPVWCLIFDSTHEGPCVNEGDLERDEHLPRGCRCSTCQEDARLEGLL